MLKYLNGLEFLIDSKWSLIFSIIFVCVISGILFVLFSRRLPKDGGREFAFNGELSKGKPRGAGLIIITVFAVAALLFIPISIENVCYYILISACMCAGYLDDNSKIPWGEYKKGLIDFIVALFTAIVFIKFNEESTSITFLDFKYEIPSLLFIIFATILIWISINVTNCADGIDGFSGVLTIITLSSIGVIGFFQ
ncbi:MAG: glycosyl transferase family 4, partial [Clostridia bacterium]|nr:glycosyl transferase family 4 [Clostridia bacterium]